MTIILIILAILIIAGIPQTGMHSYGWGPSGIVGIVLIILLIMFLTGRI